MRFLQPHGEEDQNNAQTVLLLSANLSHHFCMDQKSSQDLLVEDDVAQLLTVSVAALRRWRVERRGPKYIKLGALVRYRRSDVELWISTRPSGGEADQFKRSQRLGRSTVVTGGPNVG